MMGRLVGTKDASVRLLWPTGAGLKIDTWPEPFGSKSGERQGIIGCMKFLSGFPKNLSIFMLLLSFEALQGTAENGPDLSAIELTEGFEIDYFARDVLNARAMTLGTQGTLFVGSMRAGNVYGVVDQDGDHKADHVYTLATGLNRPTGVAFHQGDLYIAEISRISKLENIEDRLDNPGQLVTVYEELPSETHHGWKFLAFGPDDWLYFNIGAPCNICESEDDRFATLARIKPDGSQFEIYARGVRQSVGFDWHPETGDLWFTDNGRDWMGDNLPPDELNRATRSGMHFGYPYCHGGDIPDLEFGDKRRCSEFVEPVQKLGPHVAALGMTFYTGDHFPSEYKNQIFIAEHGSWNRSEKIGYRVMLVKSENGEAISYEPFAQGWLREDGSVSGRPADVLVTPDGALLVSDDESGVIYRITYTGD